VNPPSFSSRVLGIICDARCRQSNDTLGAIGYVRLRTLFCTKCRKIVSGVTCRRINTVCLLSKSTYSHVQCFANPSRDGDAKPPVPSAGAWDSGAAGAAEGFEIDARSSAVGSLSAGVTSDHRRQYVLQTPKSRRGCESLVGSRGAGACKRYPQVYSLYQANDTLRGFNTMGSSRVLSAFFAVTLASLTIDASANSVYVSPSGSDRNPGTSAAPLATIAAASKRVGPGDTVYLMPGQYSEAIVPVTSGTAQNPITYKSAGPSPAVISNVNVGILISSVGFITIDGINVNGKTAPPNANVNTWVAVQNSNNIVIKNGAFQYANGWSGIDVSGKYTADGRFWQNELGAVLDGLTTNVTIQDNTLDNVGNFYTPTGDVIQVSNGEVQRVLIQRNKITHGGHDLVEFDSDYGVLQNNMMNNSYADLIGGDTGYRSVEVRGSYNVVQGNLMEHARYGGGSATHSGPIASVRGNQNVFRNNVLYDGLDGGVITWCGAANTPVTNGRIYNNTMDRLGAGGWAIWAYSACNGESGFVFANNLVMDSRMSVGTVIANGGAIQDIDLLFAISGAGATLASGPTGQGLVKGNLFSPYRGGSANVLIMGGGGQQTLAAATGQNPQVFMANLQNRAAFVSTNPLSLADFQLQPGSPGRSAGVFLTQVVGAGTSNRLMVQDSLYFSDGNGLIPGDTIQLQGTTQHGTILSIDRASNALTLSAPITFTNGQGVALPYSGGAPDIGAQVAVYAVNPLPPSNVAIMR
jgi:hypothetical protein